MKWRVVQTKDGWVVQMLQGLPMVLDGAQISDAKWAVIAGPFRTKEEAERERQRSESK